jgi:hypothetical protein
MSLTTAQQVRTKIQDYPALVDRTYAFDGTATTYLMPDRNLTTASAYVPLGGTAWSATGITFDPTGGALFFANVGSANSAFRATYTRSTFSDDEIDTFITAGGGIIGAACQAMESLMFDSLKRSRWAAPNGQSYDDTRVLDQIATIYGQLTAQRAQETIAGGGINEWGLNQGSY